MKKTITHILIGCLCLALLPACQADVDMDHINTDMALHTGIDMPIGSLTIQLSDLMGDTLPGGIVVDSQGLYQFSSTTNLTRKIPSVDISQYVTPSGGSINLHDLLSQLFPTLVGVSFPLPAGTVFSLDYRLPLQFSGINAEGDTERLDSADIAVCQFLSVLTLDNISFSWDEIENISLTLSSDFHCDDHQPTFPTAGYDFGQVFPLDMKPFVLSLLKDASKPAGWDNIKDSTSFVVHVSFKTKAVHTITSSAAISYSYALGQFAYNAVYGYFGETVQMSDHSAMAINELWAGWEEMTDFFLPLREPRFDLAFTHPIAAPLYIDILNLSTTNRQHEKRQASFDGKPSKTTHFKSQIAVTDPLNKRVTDSIRLDYTSSGGRVDTLFSIRPDTIQYDIAMGVDTKNAGSNDQFRVTNDSIVNLRFGISAPFYFNKSARISYTQDLPIALSALSIDSLLKDAKGVKNASVDTLSLYLNTTNTIPFVIYMDLQFKDMFGQLIDMGQVKDTIPEPKKDANGNILEPAQHKVQVIMGKDKLDKLIQTDTLALKLTLGDNTTPARLSGNSTLSVALGLGTHVSAVITLDKDEFNQ